MNLAGSRVDRPEILPIAAVIAIAATIFGRALGPALQGAREGLDGIIGYTDLLGYTASYLFAFVGVFATIVQVIRTSREVRLRTTYRLLSLALTAIVLCLFSPALRENLSERASVIIGAASATLALLAASVALRVPRTRAIAATLASAALAAILHVGAEASAWCASDEARYQLVVMSRALSTASMVFDTLAIVIALAWLATRNQGRTGWATRGVLLVACVIAWGAGRGELDRASLWEVVAHRSIERLIAHPAPYLWLSYRYLLESMAPLLAVVAVSVRRQIPVICASFALVLVARPTVDIPLSALALTLASLSIPLAAQDERGMWAVLLASP